MNSFAKTLRKDQTEAEKLLWRRLRGRGLDGFKFRRQHPIGPFIVDFICPELRLIVEIDGGQHALAVGYDEHRSQYLKEQGYRVLRFWNSEVMGETEGVLMRIWEELKKSPSP